MYKYTCAYACKNVPIQFSWRSAFLFTRWKSSQQCATRHTDFFLGITFLISLLISNLWRMSPGNYHACSICSFPQFVNGGLVQLKLTFQAAAANDFLSGWRRVTTSWHNRQRQRERICSPRLRPQAQLSLPPTTLKLFFFSFSPGRNLDWDWYQKKGEKKPCLDYWLYLVNPVEI